MSFSSLWIFMCCGKKNGDRDVKSARHIYLLWFLDLVLQLELEFPWRSTAEFAAAIFQWRWFWSLFFARLHGAYSEFFFRWKTWDYNRGQMCSKGFRFTTLHLTLPFWKRFLCWREGMLSLLVWTAKIWVLPQTAALLIIQSVCYKVGMWGMDCLVVNLL